MNAGPRSMLAVGRGALLIVPADEVGGADGDVRKGAAGLADVAEQLGQPTGLLLTSVQPEGPAAAAPRWRSPCSSRPSEGRVAPASSGGASAGSKETRRECP